MRRDRAVSINRRRVPIEFPVALETCNKPESALALNRYEPRLVSHHNRYVHATQFCSFVWGDFPECKHVCECDCVAFIRSQGMVFPFQFVKSSRTKLELFRGAKIQGLGQQFPHVHPWGNMVQRRGHDACIRDRKGNREWIIGINGVGWGHSYSRDEGNCGG